MDSQLPTTKTNTPGNRVRSPWEVAVHWALCRSAMVNRLFLQRMLNTANVLLPAVC